MAEFMKKKDNTLDSSLYDYFGVSDLNNYERIIIINDNDYDKVIEKEKLDNVLIIPGDVINDDTPIYTCLKYINNSKVIYFKNKIELLEDDSIKDFIKSFTGTIICNIDMINYLKDNELFTDELSLKSNVYLVIDKYGSVKENEVE